MKLLKPQELIMPYFVVPGRRIRRPVRSMPGVCRYSVDCLVSEVCKAEDLGIGAVLLFGVPGTKDDSGRGAFADEGIVQRALRALKKKTRRLELITDVCLCEYTRHGHCGLLRSKGSTQSHRGFIDLPRTLEALAATALSHARAGADRVAPSAMMKRQVAAIRSALDANGYRRIPIMGYSAKFASSFYAPFRDAAKSAPRFGDRRSYQLDPSDTRAAMNEAAADLREGADIVMVKPALGYLDIVTKIKERFRARVAAYNVSGEYAMVKAAAKAGWIDEKKCVLEILTGLRRAGADFILTYHACDASRWLSEKFRRAPR